MSSVPKIGIDAVELARIQDILLKGEEIISKLFFESEKVYCSLYTDSAPHFAGTFAAKEAVSKCLGTDTYPVPSIEICHEKNGAPYACKDGERLQVSISITHTKDTAIAIAIG